MICVASRNACAEYLRAAALIYDMMYLLTAVGLKPGGSSTVHIYTQTVHRTQLTQTIHRTQVTQTIRRKTQLIVIHTVHCPTCYC